MKVIVRPILLEGKMSGGHFFRVLSPPQVCEMHQPRLNVWDIHSFKNKLNRDIAFGLRKMTQYGRAGENYRQTATIYSHQKCITS